MLYINSIDEDNVLLHVRSRERKLGCNFLPWHWQRYPFPAVQLKLVISASA